MSPLDDLRRPRNSVLAGVGAAGALLVVASLLTPGVASVPTQPVAEPVMSSELVCAVTTATNALTSTVTAGVAPLATVKDGIATLADLTTGAGADPLVIKQPGQEVTRVISGKSGPAQLARATGSFAQGLGADQTIRSGEGPTRGLATQPCARPVTDAWLVGGGSTVGRLTQVLLVNDDDRPAQVDLLVYGRTGPVAAPSASGIVLKAGERKQVRIDALAPNQPLVAVHVVARAGRIGVVGLDQNSFGLIPYGMSLIPPTQAGKRLVIPGVPAPVHYAGLVLLAPDADATVQVALLTPDGTIPPDGFSTVALEAGKVTSISMTVAMANQATGVLVRSDAPVVAGVEVGTGTTATLRERDATAATEQLDAPGIVVGLAGGALKHAVMLSAPEAASTVRLELYVPGRGAPAWRRTLEVPAGSERTIGIPVTTPTASSMLVVTPVSGGPLWASRQVTEAGRRGPMIGLAPILPTRATAQVPPVVSWPGSSVPGLTAN